MKSSPPPNPPNRGFTLVEILVAITVIAILAGILLVAVFPVLNTSRELAIKMELTQLESAIEDFKTKFGYYPPSFVGIKNAKDMASVINRLFPGNAETARIDPDDRRSPLYIELWWEGVGRHIQHESGEDLVFWLSGLIDDRAFPLSNGVKDANSMPFAFGNDFDGIERKWFYKFRKGQLFRQIDRLGAHPTINRDKIACYSQASNEAVPFLYIDNGNYLTDFTFPQGSPPPGPRFTGYWRWRVPPPSGNRPNIDFLPENLQQFQQWRNWIVFENPNTFQLVAAGIDKSVGRFEPSVPNLQYILGRHIFQYSSADADNLTNFTDGKLGGYADSEKERFTGN